MVHHTCTFGLVYEDHSMWEVKIYVVLNNRWFLIPEYWYLPNFELDSFTSGGVAFSIYPRFHMTDIM